MPAAIDILTEDTRWDDIRLAPLASRALSAVFSDQGISGKGYSVSVLACDDARIAELNAEFRGKPVPTNVLSWPEHDLAALHDGDAPGKPPAPMGFDDSLGDIAISYDTCAREAAEGGLAFGEHVTHLLVHATMHLLGYDHERENDAALMEGLETKILATLGIKDPYC